MKFIKTINWSFINWEDVCEINHEMNCVAYYGYFILKNGSKIDTFDAPDYFCCGEDTQKYEFCSQCYSKYHEIMINYINDHFLERKDIFDVDAHEDKIWERFMYWAMYNTEKLILK